MARRRGAFRRGSGKLPGTANFRVWREGGVRMEHQERYLHAMKLALYESNPKRFSVGFPAVNGQARFRRGRLNGGKSLIMSGMRGKGSVSRCGITGDWRPSRSKHDRHPLSPSARGLLQAVAPARVSYPRAAAVRRLRIALQGERGSPSLVHTVGSRGYRLNVRVECLAEPDGRNPLDSPGWQWHRLQISMRNRAHLPRRIDRTGDRAKCGRCAGLVSVP